MNRDQAKNHLVDYFNGHCSEEKREAIEDLLEQDDSLRADAELIKNEMKLFRSSLEDPWEEARLTNISERVMKKMRQNRSGFAAISPVFRSYLRAVVAAMLIIAALFGLFLLTPREVGESDLTDAALLQTPRELQQRPLRIVRLSLTTDNPRVRIYWTKDRDFKPLEEGE